MAGITALIPARGGSKGVHRKNIVSIAGYPLIAYSIAACKMSEKISRVVVSTEDEEIAEIATNYGAVVPFMRPRKYATDSSTDFDVLNHFLFKCGYFEGGYKDSLIAYIRPTTPIRNPYVMDQLIKSFIRSDDFEQATGARSAHEMPESPYKCYLIKNKYFNGMFSDFNGIKNYANLPRQMFPTAYQPNGYIDLIKPKTIMDGKTFGDKVFPLITNYTLEIDTGYQLKTVKERLSYDCHGSIIRYLRGFSDADHSE